MGRIFTWNEVSQGRIPRTEAFIIVMRSVERIIRRFGEEGWMDEDELVGWYGSSTRPETLNLRSDLDLIWVTHHPDGLPQEEVIASIRETARRQRVPIEILLLPTIVATTPAAAFDPGLMDHIRWALTHGGGLLHGYPSILYDGPTDAHVAGAEAYLGLKISKALKYQQVYPRGVQNPWNRSRLGFLETCLHAGPHALRKVVSVLVPDHFTPNMSPAEILATLELCCPGDVTNRFRTLLEREVSYTHLLEEHLTQPIGRRRYYQELDRLEFQVANVEVMLTKALECLVRSRP